MANLALYRKYRPRTFDELKGQEHVTAPLIQALKNGKLNHAYLFSGPRGCGKTSSARILARSLNCVEGPTPSPCGVCDSCVALAPDGPGSLDVVEIDAASHGGVDDARDLRERAFFAPVSSRFKIYVIDEAHMVSPAGFNALLKLVEEPPEFVKFVFATTEPEKVLTTIRSRTHHYPFRLLPPGALRALLDDICKSEGVTIEPSVYPLIVRAGGGSARDALSVLDQLISGAGEDGVTYAGAVGLLGVTDAALLDEACDALAAADGAGLLGTVDRVVEAGHDPRRFASDLLERLRDLLILEKVPDAAAKGLIDVPADELERMTGQALRLGGATLSRLADVVHDGLVEMRGTTSPRLLLELVCARMVLPGADDGQGALLQRLERLERRFEIGGQPVAGAPSAVSTPARTVPAVSESAPAPRTAVSEPAAPPRSEPVPAAKTVAREPAVREPSTPSRPTRTKPATAPAEVAGPSPEAPAEDAGEPAGAPESERIAGSGPVGTSRSSAVDSPPPAEPVQEVPPVMSQPVVAPQISAPVELDATAVRRVWPEILERVKKRRVVWSLLQNAVPAAVNGNELVLTVQHQGLARRFADEAVVGLIQEALRDVLGVTWRIKADVDGSGRSVPATATATKQVTAPVPEPAESGWPTVAPAGPGSAPPADDVPPPPEPAFEGFDPGDEPVEEEPVDPGEPVVRRDADAEAIALLEQQLGAKRVT